MPLKAVIFDVDGVLVQSMERHAEAYQRAFSTIGVSIDAAEVYANEGRRSREVIESLAAKRKLPVTKEQLESLNKIKQDTFYGFGPLPLYPGVRELVDNIRSNDLKIAAATGTNRANVNQNLAELLSRLDVIVTADDVKKTKPDPEPYLTALAKLGVRADEAIVVENAALGIQSARAAGIRVIGVTSTMPAEALRAADVIVPQLLDAWEPIRRAMQ